MGTAGEMMLTPFGSMIVGFLAGTISVLGFKFLSVSSQKPLSLSRQPSEEKRMNQSETASSPRRSPPSAQPILESKLKIQDTCGVHNLHGMPGVLGAVVGAVTAALATMDVYGNG